MSKTAPLSRGRWHIMRFLLGAAAILSLLNGIGCATISMTSATATEAFEAPSDLPDAARLDVALIEFDPNLPADGEPIPDDLYPEIRQAEAKLLPTQLEKTLEQTKGGPQFSWNEGPPTANGRLGIRNSSHPTATPAPMPISAQGRF